LFRLLYQLFPTKDRGTGNGLAGMANRIFGIMAPIIALYADLTVCDLLATRRGLLKFGCADAKGNHQTAVPIYVSGALFIVAGFIALLLPFEPRGRLVCKRDSFNSFFTSFFHVASETVAWCCCLGVDTL